MGKRLKRQPKPRHLTIRIQYHPIPRFVLVAFLCIFIFSGFINFSNRNIVILERSDNEAIESFQEILSKSLLLQDDYKKDSFLTFDNNGQVIFHGSRDRKEIALTFDADMTPGMKSLVEKGQVVTYYDKRVIDTLNATQTKATLFLSGMWIEMYKNEAKELAANSLFELASHSYSHPSFHGQCFGLGEIPDSRNQEEIQKTQELLQELTGINNTLFRFPGGCYSQTDVDIAAKNGLKVIQWDAAGRDGFNNDTISIENNVIQNVKNGSIIVLHMHGAENAPKTAEALPKIIKELKEQGYQFVTISELLEERKTEQVFKLQQLLSYNY